MMRRKTGIIEVIDDVPESRKRRVGWGCLRSCMRRVGRRKKIGINTVNNTVPESHKRQVGWGCDFWLFIGT